ncbi:MAG TPA: FKBP-type peptidyl-prolyl cis-trans isomerase [Kofleriaceae bacterium]
MSRLVLISLLLVTGCQKSDGKKQDPTAAKMAEVKRPKTPQVEAPLDIKNPPADAVRAPSGLIYKTLVANAAGTAPKRNDTVMIKYTGWRQSSGETFFSNKTAEQAMPLNLSSTAPGFTEGMQQVKKGERAMLWLPPEIGLKEKPKDGPAETLVYEVEVVDIVAAPAIPPDTAQPPVAAKTTKSGIKYLEVRAGTGKDKPTSADDVTFNYSAWNTEGRMLETTEMKNRPVKSPAFRQPQPFEEVLLTMTGGQRVRFWVEAEKMKKPQVGPATGLLTYEVDLVTIEKSKNPPPPTPFDVAKPPGDAKKSEKGIFYKVLKAGKGGPKPTPNDAVRVHYTGWTTDGRMFDSSVLKGEPAEFQLRGVIAGWTEGIPLMSVGDRFRFWIPDHMAYKGQPDRPQGMLVFEVELIEIKPAAAPDNPHGGNPHGGHGH